ncbi:kelch repeat and btb domain-containing protein [Anaeramoeba ignava]|uniref:Kelch repeat and btb domain-containing protein n=1 Tax=Anaeramoeba ignava TaxID=1746090 RepID=A0A9Q0LJI3_ANAIG|nr:kelch repeat and btb domain-containing protein [Anaeramoeba ignava]
MKRIYLNENEKDFTIERASKSFNFHKLILIMRSELYRGMFLSVTNDTSNKVTDYSELSDESFEILEYWIYTNKIKKGIKITQKILDEIERGMDYFQLNESKNNILLMVTEQFKNQN